MIYDSLDIIPYKTFLKIEATLDYSLLSNDRFIDMEKLIGIWETLYEDHLSKNQSSESKKIFKISKEIDSLLANNKSVVLACDCLRFDWNNDLVEMLLGYGYQLRNTDTETYYSDIDLIEREANAYIIKAERFKSMLPQEIENNASEQTFSIDDVMGSYSLILGFDFDYNQITYTKFHALQNQVNAKMKALEKQSSKSNGK